MDTIASFLINQATEAANATATNGTAAAKPKSTPEGMMVAYSSLVIMALLPIVIGAKKSVKHQENQKKNSEVSRSMI